MNRISVVSKSVACVALSLASVFCLKTQAFEKKAAPSSASLHDTVEYIVMNFNSTAFTIMRLNPGRSDDRVNATVVPDDACAITLETRTKSDGYEESRSVLLNLRNLEIKSIREIVDITRVRYGGATYSLDFRMASPTRVIIHTKNLTSDETSSQMTSSFTLWINGGESEIGKRMVAALTHAVMLCGGGGKSPF